MDQQPLFEAGHDLAVPLEHGAQVGEALVVIAIGIHGGKGPGRLLAALDRHARCHEARAVLAVLAVDVINRNPRYRASWSGTRATCQEDAGGQVFIPGNIRDPQTKLAGILQLLGEPWTFALGRVEERHDVRDANRLEVLHLRKGRHAAPVHAVLDQAKLWLVVALRTGMVGAMVFSRAKAAARAESPVTREGEATEHSLVGRAGRRELSAGSGKRCVNYPLISW